MSERAQPAAITAQATRFAVSGVLVTAFHATIATCLIRFGSAPPPVANGIAFLSATTMSYLMNTIWTFSAPLHGRTLARFCIVSLIGLALAMLISGAAEAYHFNYGIGILFVVLSVPPFTFIVHRYWTYR